MDLSSLKYADLRRLAKDVGLKANMKADKLLKQLEEYYRQHETNGEKANRSYEADVQAKDESAASPATVNSAFVTKRRARGKTTKRKLGMLEDEVELDLSVTENRVQCEKVDEPKGVKRRLVSREVHCQPVVVSEPGDKQDKHPQSVPTEEEPVKHEKDKVTVSTRAGKIPRHKGLLKRESRVTLKPTTPNFKKIHEAHFNKMESIDSYIQRKDKQMKLYINSNELKVIPKREDTKSPRPSASRVSLFSPVVKGKRQSSEQRGLARPSGSKPTLKASGVFVPTILSTRRINVRFSQATQDNEHKQSLTKTPARRSSLARFSSTPAAGPPSQTKHRGKATDTAPSVSHVKTAGTPFIFSGNTSSSATPGTNKKNVFDLKASLSRPLTYQPHKGKLKPFGLTQENGALNNSHQSNYKQHQVETRADRRAKLVEDRKQKKEKMVGARRGLILN